MRKTTVSLLLLLTLAGTTEAQNWPNLSNIWYFNFNCGIDFNSGTPVSINNSAMSTNEGCTSVCDTAGNLQFYSNGVTVYNKNHQVMNNGSNLHGGVSASQSCVAMPLPGSYTTWYLFTCAETGGTYGAQYSIIDMTAQGGLGSVVTKNVPLITPVDEKLTACFQTNGTDYWIAYHGTNNNKIYVFPLTSAGVGTVVTSQCGALSNYYVGCMRFSPDGKRLAVANYNLANFQIFDFNDTTGVCTYAFTIPCGAGFASYGLEWSRDSRHLFLGNVDYMPGQVFEADMSLPDSTSIVNSLVLIVNSSTDILGSLQMAPDGRIYLNRYNVTDLGVINYPDSMGAACNYVSNGFSTAPHYNYLGLPNYPSGWFAVSNEVLPSFSTSDTSLCQKFCANFYDSSTNNPTAWLWTFPGGNPDSSTDQNPMNICYDSAGVFDVTLQVTNNAGTSTITYPGYITVYSNPFAPTITQVGNVLTSSAATTYQWQLNQVDIPGATNQSYTISQSGLYTVIISNDNGCNAQADVDASYTGMNQLAGDAAVFISPNPSNGVFNIRLLNCEGDLTSMFQVVNPLGQVVFSSEETISNAVWTKEIDLGDVAEGIYFIQLKTTAGNMTRKLLVK